jgi:hypothetical protein
VSGPSPWPPQALVVDRFGRTVFLEDGSVHRLLPDGSPDPSFGHDGVASLKVGGYLGRLAVAPNGSVFATGTKRIHRATAAPLRRLIIASLTAKGRPRRGFGTDGAVTLRSQTGVATTGRGVMVDAMGRPVVAGSVYDPRLPDEQGLALYRFDLGGR